MRSLTFLAAATLSSAGIPEDYPFVPMRGVNGTVRMPLVGLGTVKYDQDAVQQVILDAFEVGFRHVDTSSDYRNQVGVGRALKQTGVPREQYFVTTKIPGGTDFNHTLANLEQTLQELDLDYVDLMLAHFPANYLHRGGAENRKQGWLAMEEFARRGKVRAIGVSHYCRSHIEDVREVSTMPVALNQVQYHVGMGHSPDAGTDDKAWMIEQGIVYMSFSTLCGLCVGAETTELISGPLVTDIGVAHNASGAQVSLRWATQRGIPVVPESANPEHMRQNLEHLRFTLTDADLARLDAATTPTQGAQNSGDCGIESTFTV